MRQRGQLLESPRVLFLLTLIALLGMRPAPLAAQTAGPGDATPAPTEPPSITREPGSTRKVCQLTGEIDRERREATPALTQTRFGLVGADLGSSFQHRGRIYFLFGDSGPSRGPSSERPLDGDSVGYTEDLLAKGCSGLRMVTAPDGFYRSPFVPGISLGGFEVPTGGFSDGASIYVFFTTDSSADQVMGRSVLARSDDGGQTFRYLYDVSRDKFINIAAAVVSNAAVRGLPSESGRGVLFWASGAYRASSPYLAWAPLDSIETRSAWRYFAGIDPDSRRPRWSASEAQAAPLFSHPCLGELSVGWNPFLRVWLMLYNCDDPRGIVYRAAAHPWGPWSAAAVLFDPWTDGGYCHFIHTSWDYWVCDQVHDLGREREWGGEYGAYLVGRYATGDSAGSTIYFTMSTWNPYATVLMQATLRTTAAGTTSAGPLRTAP
jgi:hypothetical protein